MQQQTLLSWLALLRAPHMTPKKFYQLSTFFVDLNAVFSSTAELEAFKLHEQTQAYLKQADWRGAERDLDWANQTNHHIITIKDSNYPRLLTEINSRPPILFIHGNPDCLATPQLAMVGSRNPTHSGQEIAATFAAQLSNMGFTITSGLALGIDAASHQGALAKSGKTIAVLGTGVDVVYPRSHTRLAHAIAEQGALVSEFPLGTRPQAWHFPQRNRIISGLSLGALVIEAALGSGSLITAKYALEQNREVFAVPGSIHNPTARGCHALIRQGAKLVETVNDICEELSGFVNFATIPSQQPTQLMPVNTEQAKLLAALDFSPCSLDIVIMRSGLTVSQASINLVELEMQGYVENKLGNYVRIK